MPSVLPSTHSCFSMRCQPVKSRPSALASGSRPSVSGSRSPKISATGSMRSQYVRATGNSFFASSVLPALTAATNSSVFSMSALACDAT